jgi:hypothetical protein
MLVGHFSTDCILHPLSWAKIWWLTVIADQESYRITPVRASDAMHDSWCIGICRTHVQESCSVAECRLVLLDSLVPAAVSYNSLLLFMTLTKSPNPTSHEGDERTTTWRPRYQHVKFRPQYIITSFSSTLSKPSMPIESSRREHSVQLLYEACHTVSYRKHSNNAACHTAHTKNVIRSATTSQA